MLRKMKLSQGDYLKIVREIYMLGVLEKNINGAREKANLLKYYLRFGEVEEISDESKKEISDLCDKINHASFSIL